MCEWNFDERHAECVPQRLNPVFELPPAVDEPCGAGDIETPDADLTDADSTDDGGAK